MECNTESQFIKVGVASPVLNLSPGTIPLVGELDGSDQATDGVACFRSGPTLPSGI